MLISLIALDYLVNFQAKDDPTERKARVKEELEADERSEEVILSDDIFYGNEEFVYYRDRIVRRFAYREEYIENMRRGWENLSASFPEDVNSFIVPISNRVIFEEGYSRDKAEYEDYYRKLEESFTGLASVLDLREVFKEHKDEYIFYRTYDSITARGGYYASKEVAKALEIKDPISLDSYEEHMYRKYRGDLYALERAKFDKSSEIYELLEKIPQEPIYYYILGEAMNASKVFLKDEDGKIENIKRPTISKSGLGHGSIISSKSFQWAIVEGDGKAENKKDETLLFISDESGRYMLPYLANYYRDIYYINLKWNNLLGSELQEVQEIFDNYPIKDVIYSQNAYEMGNPDSSRTMKKFFHKDDRDLFDNLAGVMEKRKIRLRTYSPDSDWAKLEYKSKSNTDGRKTSLIISKDQALLMERGRSEFLLEREEDFAKFLYNEITANAYRPKTIIQYERIAYFYAINDFRISFDTSIRGTIDPYGLFKKDLALIPLLNEDLGVLEIKYNGFLPSFFKSIIYKIDNLAEANSKYSESRLLI